MRATLAFLLLLVGVVLVPVATVAWWADHELVPADRFVATVAPLATEPAVTDEVEDRLTAETTSRIAEGSGVVGAQVEPAVRLAVQRAVADPAYARVWSVTSRDVHRQLTGILRARTSATGDVGLRLAPLSDAVRQELVSSGVPFAGQLPTVQATVPLLPADDLAHARGAYRLLEERGRDLQLLALGLIALGLLVAPRRASALGYSCLAVVIELGMLACVVLGARFVSPDAVPGSLPTPMVHAVFDALVAGLWRDLAIVAGVAFVLLLAAMARRTTGSRTARR